ncbi:hypothetical protein GEMRC1_008931 [Eukaryota sp. GEM-RC1]
MSSSFNILLFDASGRQGTNFLEGLRHHAKFNKVAKVRCFCSHETPHLRSLISQSNGKYELFLGDLRNEENIQQSMNGMDTVCLLLNPKEYGKNLNEGSSAELQLGMKIIDMANQAGVFNFVYGGSQAACCSAVTVPHYHSKCKIESYLRDHGTFSRKNIVRASWLMENLIYDESVANSIRQEKKLRLPLTGDCPLFMCSIRDVARVQASCCLIPGELEHHNGIIEVVSDRKTPNEMAQRLGCTFEQRPMSELSDSAYQQQYEYLQSQPVHPDIDYCSKCFPNLVDFDRFINSTGWNNFIEKGVEALQQEQRATGISR